MTAPESGLSHEIGLDFAPFVRGQQGLSLLYKQKLGQTTTHNWQKQTAFRLLTGFYKEPIGSDGLPYQKGDTIFVQNSVGDANRYFINMGVERQLIKNKFRFYYGGDIGFRGSVSNLETQVDATANGSTFPYDEHNGEVTTRAAELSAFAGCNYFFLPRFSIGLEVFYSVGIEFSTAKIIRDGEEVGAPHQQATFVGSTNFPRLLYLSFHF